MKRGTKTLFNLIAILSISLALLVVSGRAQQDKDQLTPRDIKSDSFVKKRTNKKVLRRHKSRRYTYKRKTRRYRRKYKSSSKRPVVRKKVRTAKPVDVQIGVTMWKLRPPRKGETGPLMNVQISETVDEEWIPERVGADTVFREGDMIRLAVESTVEGYLYIISSEIYSDENIGVPKLIFPETLEIDNRVEAGMLVDIPDETEDYPYFRITTKRKDYEGEALLIVIVRRPLKNLVIGEYREITSLDLLKDIEDEAEAQIFTRTDGLGRVLTTSEKAATCGIRKRDLTRDRKKKPCPGKIRRLSADSEPPQTIYRTKSYPGVPIAFPVVMNVKGG